MACVGGGSLHDGEGVRGGKQEYVSDRLFDARARIAIGVGIAYYVGDAAHAGVALLLERERGEA